MKDLIKNKKLAIVGPMLLLLAILFSCMAGDLTNATAFQSGLVLALMISGAALTALVSHLFSGILLIVLGGLFFSNRLVLPDSVSSFGPVLGAILVCLGVFLIYKSEAVRELFK